MPTVEVIKLLKEGAPVEEVVLQDIEEQKIGFRDALLLVEHGFVVPMGNIVYRDEDIVEDPEFEGVTWEGNYGKLRDLLVVQGLGQAGAQEPVSSNLSIQLSIQDQAVQVWLQQNSNKLERLVHKLVLDLYHTEKMLREEG